MTWAEFKREVEKQGVQDNDHLAWIDVSGSASDIEVWNNGDSDRDWRIS